jgi:hypothetical protein
VLRDALGDPTRGVEVPKEVLAEVFFGANVHG